MTAIGTGTTGMVLNIQRLSTEDGPGIRSTVFLKGCPLACSWCHNPESISPQPQLHWLQVRCIDCGTCLQSCPQDCLTFTPDGLQIDREVCDGCGECAEACPANALELLGNRRQVVEVFTEVCKDRSYYQTSAGGVTISGGEPSMQPAFSAELLQALRAEEIHTALDTCGLFAWDKIVPLLVDVDLILYDLKLIDNERHRYYTGQGNVRILENLLRLRDAIRREELSSELWIRTPLIPGATATPENIGGIGHFLHREMGGCIARWELCAFNNLCQDKYKRLEQNWEFSHTALLTAAEVEEFAAIARDAAGTIPVVASGPNQLEAA